MAKSYLKAAVPASVGAAVLPYLVMKKKDNETQRSFEARRRGMMAALGATAGISAGHFIPPRLIKSASLRDYLERERAKGLAEQRKSFFARTKDMTEDDKRQAEADFAERANRRREGFTNSSLLGRGFGVAAGGALLSKNLPQLAKARGSQMLYHGTDAGAIQGILGDSDTSGLHINFAGTKGRLNAKLMPNAVVREILTDPRLADKFTEADVARIQNMVNRAIESNDGKPILSVIGAELDKVKDIYGLSSDEAGALKSKAKTGLSEAGMRIYFGNSPDKVVTWTDDLNEKEKILNSVGDDDLTGNKMQGKMLFEATTGGVGSEVKDTTRMGKYYDNLTAREGKVSLEYMRQLARDNPNLQYVVGADVPTHDVQDLADFKGVRTPLRMLPAFQGILSAIPGFEGYNPNNDISTAESVAREHIKHVDVVNPETGKATRMFLDSYQAPKLTAKQRLKALRGAAVPLGLSAMGADAIYRGVSGRKGVLGTLADKYLKSDKAQEKRAGAMKYTPVRSGLADTAKYILPATAAAFGIGVASDALKRRILPVEDYEHSPVNIVDEGKGLARETARGFVGKIPDAVLGYGGMLAAGGLGGLLKYRGAAKQLKELGIAADKMPEKLKRRATLLGAGLGVGGYTGGAMLGMYPIIKYKDAARGRDELRTELGETPESQMASPWKSAIVPGLISTGIGASAAIAGRKYFPGFITAEMRKRVLLDPALSPKRHVDAIRSIVDDIDTGRGATLSDLESVKENAELADAVPGLGQMYNKIRTTLEKTQDDEIARKIRDQGGTDDDVARAMGARVASRQQQAPRT